MTEEKFQAKIILTVGISNCGKSTWAKEFIKKNPMFTEINRDDTRIAFFTGGNRSEYGSYKFSREKEALITQVAETRATFALNAGQGVVISDTNLNSKTRNFWKSFASKHKVPYEEEVFNVPLHVCVKRNIKRDITLPKSVLIRQYKDFRKFMKLPTYVGDPLKTKAVIFDVDGTLADMTGIRKPFEWDKVGQDKPRQNICELARMYNRAGYAVVVMSGRDGICFQITQDWLTENNIPFHSLFLREPGDQRSDAIFKEESFWENVAPHYDVKLVVDDRDQMVDRWRSIGLECMQVADGEF